jgi:hypothetical protein
MNVFFGLVWIYPGKSKRTEHTRRVWKSGARRTYREKKKEGSLRKDRDIWTNETNLPGVIRESRKREKSNDDGVFMQHQKGPITSTFTADWFLKEGEGRELLGEWV